MASADIDVLPAPIRRGRWTRAELIRRLKIGMQVELSTIPLYLYAYYSINVEANISPPEARVAGANARFAILGVFQQEMLHLTLIGNILRAVDETPMTLYRSDFIPTYPNTVLSSKIPMNLTRAGRESFGNFLKIEAPYYPPPPSTPPPPGVFAAKTILPDDHSIGEFYANLVEGIEELSRTQNLFATPRLNLQFGGNMFNRDILVRDKNGALQALDVVTEQGEGGVSTPESHYAVFANLYHRKQDWICYDVIRDPHSVIYPNGAVKELVLAFNASYCYLLLTIEQVWAVAGVDHRRHLTRNIHSIMMAVITPLASLLVQQRVFYGGQLLEQNAGPCFEYYPTTTGPGTPTRLHQAIRTHLNAASTQAPNLRDRITPLLYSVDQVAPYSGN